MEVIKSSPVQDCSGMENDRGHGAAKLSRSQRKRRIRQLNKKKWQASLELSNKREGTENPDSKLEVPHRNVDIITQSSVQDDPNTGLHTTAPVDQKSTVSSAAATGDGKSSISKKEGYMEIAKGEKGSSRTTTVDFKTGSKREEYMETANGETGSGTTAIDNTTSKKRKRQKLKNKTATPDTKIVSKGEKHTKVANGEMSSSTTKNLNVNDTVKKGKKKTSKKRRPTIGEILNPRYLQDMETAIGETGSGATATDKTASKKRKRQKLKNKKPVSGDILTTCENRQDTVIAKKGLCTNKVLEAMSTESKREHYPEIVKGEKCLRTTPLDAEITMLKSLGCTEVANSEMGSSRTMTIVENTGASGISTLDMKTVSKREEHTKIVNVITHVATSGKKLLIFDVNGFLADIVSPPPKDFKADKYIPKRAIFKRPFLDDFLCFCFERFNVAIWSSRTKKILDPVINYLLGDLRKKLLFLWDASSCTNSGTRTLEDKHKCIVFKDLRKIWQKNGPDNRWVKGTFDESNTLLLDDSPYKALLNPKHTGLFPVAYSYKNTDDNFLGPNGDLRTYLEGVAATDNLKMYVEQHPFGQGAIDETNPHWAFYSRVLKGQK